MGVLWRLKNDGQTLVVSEKAGLVAFAPYADLVNIVPPGMEKAAYIHHEAGGPWEFMKWEKVAAIPALAEMAVIKGEARRRYSMVLSGGYSIALYGPFSSPLEFTARGMITATPHGVAQVLVDSFGLWRFGGPGWVAIPPNMAALSVE